MYDPYMESRQLSYKPVIAYTADRPILVNGYDINTGLYPVLNFKPEGAKYPYIYVPIAEFSRVGAKVTWDESRQVLTVTTDYYQMKSDFEEFQRYYNMDVSKLIRSESDIERLSLENQRLKEQLSQI